MNPTPAPATEPPTAVTAAAPPQSSVRRFFAKALFGTALSGLAAHLGHPWIMGERREELTAAMQAWQGWLKKVQQARPHRPHPPLAAAGRPAPIALDAAGHDYETFLAGLGLRHIRPMELLRPHFNVRGSIANCLPPRECWRNITATLRVADQLREQLGARLLTILSAYRSPAYNAACPGAATHSYHLRNMALDLVYDCPPAEVVKAAESLRDTGFFSGGIGRYPGFTHIDTRGYQADWG